MIPTFIGITLIGFFIMRLAPGDPAELRAAGGLGAAAGAGISVEKRGAVDEAMAQWRAQFGLDKPLHVQYLVWLKNIATLNFGESFKDSQSVWGKITETAAGYDQIEPVVDSRRLFGRDSVGNLLRHPSQHLRRPGHDVGRVRLVCRALGLGRDDGDRIYLRRRFLLSFSAGRARVAGLFGKLAAVAKI